MELFKRILKLSLLVAGVAIIISAFITGGMTFPLGIFVGALAGILNLRAIIRNVSSITAEKPIRGRYIILSIFRLLVLFLILFLLIWKGLVDVFGILLGFTIVFVIIIEEGLREAGQMR